MNIPALCIAVLLLSFSAKGQKMNGEVIEDRLLTWKDFKGKSNSDVFDAKTYTWMSYESTLENSKYVYKVTCLFDPKQSWVSKDFLKKSDASVSAHLLKHEQVHYDIARIIAAEMDAVMNSFKYDSKRTRYQADSIYRSYLKKDRDIQKLYDTETNHSKIPEEQAKWNDKIKAALEKKTIEM